MWPRFLGIFQLPGIADDINLLVCPRYEDRDTKVPLVPGDFYCCACRRQISVARTSEVILSDPVRPIQLMCRRCFDRRQVERSSYFA